MCINVGDVHQLVGHCLIPLNPWSRQICLAVNQILLNINNTHRQTDKHPVTFIKRIRETAQNCFKIFLNAKIIIQRTDKFAF